MKPEAKAIRERLADHYPTFSRGDVEWLLKELEELESKTKHIVNADDLLQNIAAGLNQHDQTNIACLEVVLYFEDDPEYAFDVATILDYLANDIWWNEERDWSQAIRAEVRVL